MDVLLSAVIGTTIIGLALADMINVTFGLRADGFLSRRITAYVWRLMCRGRRGVVTHRLLATAGPLLMLLVPEHGSCCFGRAGL